MGSVHAATTGNRMCEKRENDLLCLQKKLSPNIACLLPVHSSSIEVYQKPNCLFLSFILLPNATVPVPFQLDVSDFCKSNLLRKRDSFILVNAWVHVCNLFKGRRKHGVRCFSSPSPNGHKNILTNCYFFQGNNDFRCTVARGSV